MLTKRWTVYVESWREWQNAQVAKLLVWSLSPQFFVPYTKLNRKITEFAI